MSYRPLVNVGSYDFPEPSEYNGTVSTFVDSARNTSGTVVGSVIRENVAKVEMKWSLLSNDDWSDIIKCFDSTYGGNFYRDVTFYDMVSKTWVTRKMYVSDRKAGLFLRDRNTGEFKGQRNCSLSLVEV